MKLRRTSVLAIAAAGLIGMTLTTTPSDAGWRGGGWRGAGWGGGWRGGYGGWRGGYGGWGYRRYGGWGPGVAVGAAAVGVGLGLAAASTWGYPGYGYGYYAGYPGCLRQVWWGGAWRLVNYC